MKDFIDKTIEKKGTPVNRKNLLAIQGYQDENVSFGDDVIVKTNSNGETETITFSDNTITKVFVGEKTVTQKITFGKNGYTKEVY